jgi:hypothetical protein
MNLPVPPARTAPATGAHEVTARGSFKQLLENENFYLDENPREGELNGAKSTGGEPPQIVESPVTGEPWVSHTAIDRCGLALSGGGIRSAAFNLGLLQGLNARKMLEHIDYLSTVSGGGYAGGFWSSWRFKNRGGPMFPAQDTSDVGWRNRNSSEPLPIRHLREYSRFLMPRFGLLRMDVWEGIATILSGLLPALLASLAVLAAMNYLWFFLAFFSLNLGPIVGGLSLAVFAICYFVFAERALRPTVWSESEKNGFKVYRIISVFAALAISVLWIGFSAAGFGNLLPAIFHVGIEPMSSVWASDSRNLTAIPAPVTPALVLAIIGCALIFLRTLLSRFLPVLARKGSNGNGCSWPEPVDRLIARCLWPALTWLVLSAIWQICLFIETLPSHRNS